MKTADQIESGAAQEWGAPLSAAEPLADGPIRIGAIAICPSARTVRVNGAPVHFTPTEFRLIECLARWRGAILSREVLLDELYGESGRPGATHFDFYLHKVRQKLRSACAGRDYIRHLSDGGYVFFDWTN